ncbi:MAG: hypothetical protein AB7I48_28630, partial [Planctomycetaceae bacterium]
QNSVVGVRIEPAMVDSWQEFLNEAEALLQGKKLIPFWRGNTNRHSAKGELRGVNLRRVFTEPKPFDVVLWATGSGANAYLEIGPVTDAETWTRIQQGFGGSFFGFAVWIN